MSADCRAHYRDKAKCRLHGCFTHDASASGLPLGGGVICDIARTIAPITGNRLVPNGS